MRPQISVKEMSVVFPIFDQLSRSAKSHLIGGNGANTPSKLMTALNCVSLEIDSGERVGFLGKNGAGKSTLLRALAGVFQPVSGEILIQGKIMSLFDVSVGMDQDASGYDNIPLIMATRGISMKLLNEITKSVEEFSELGEALFRPVRTYSAGMRLRIAFAIATSQHSDVLLMDEVIGVGDQNFKDKSKARIENFMLGAGTLILASHSNSYLNAFCERGIVFSSGKIAFDGPIANAIKFHQEQQVSQKTGI